MNILHIVHQYPPEHIGGTELYTRWLAEHQVALGHQVAVVCPTAGEQVMSAPEFVLEKGVRVYRIPVGRPGRLTVFSNTFAQGRLSRVFAQVLEAEQPQLVHVQHLMGLPVAVVEQLRARGIPYVITLHDYWYRCANAQLLTNYDQTICAGPDEHWHNCGRCALARAGLNRIARLAPLVAPVMGRRGRLLEDVFAGARRVIAPADFMRRTYASMGLPTNHVTVVPFGLDVGCEQIEAARTAAAQRTDQMLRIGYAGSIAWQKGVHVLIAAFNQLPHRGAELLIYGNPATFPDYVATLQRMAGHPHIRFAGSLSREALWAAFGGLDVLVVPSVWYEGSPFIIREAFAAGLPVVASRIGALPEMVREGVDGLLFTAGEAAELRDVLQQLLDDQTLLARLRANVEPVLSFADHVEMVAGIYQQVLKS